MVGFYSIKSASMMNLTMMLESVGVLGVERLQQRAQRTAMVAWVLRVREDDTWWPTCTTCGLPESLSGI